jgi:two-component system OmpR family response regulator
VSPSPLGRRAPSGYLRSRAARVQLPVMAMAVVTARAPDAGREAGLRGRLEQFGLATVLTFLDLERRSGELLLLASGGVGRLWLQHGRVVRARIEGSRRARKAAVYELLTWSGGRFAFIQTDASHIEDEIGASTPMLLIEAARRTDEQQNEARGAAP